MYNGQMTSENDNLKDTTPGAEIAVKDNPFFISSSKTNKLITALYMVTDIIDKEEPLRNKLRTLGAGIISDMHATPGNALSKIAETLSFLDVASAINLISEMNFTILKKEFLVLKRSIEEKHQTPVTLSEFFTEEKRESLSAVSSQGYLTRIGVQKGSTLMKALSKLPARSAGGLTRPAGRSERAPDAFKEERKKKIIDILKRNGGGLSIRDVSLALHSQGQGGDTSEKTLQRQLVSMLKDNSLYRTGSKRWSRYFVKSS